MLNFIEVQTEKSETAFVNSRYIQTFQVVYNEESEKFHIEIIADGSNIVYYIYGIKHEKHASEIIEKIIYQA